MRNLQVGTYEHITVTPVSGSLGAEISGVDLAIDLSDAVVAEIRRAWLDHLVVFFHDQGHITNPQYVAFARRIGEPSAYPFVKGFDDQPEIIPIMKLAHETVNFGGVWHADTVYLDQPPMATMLLARELPPAGGDTMYANQYDAFESLSPTLQVMLDGMRAVNSSALADVSKTREDRLKDHGSSDAASVYEVTHPVVRTHPETGRKALFVNIAHTSHFEGMTVAESRPLLEYLFKHQVRYEFTCRFRWKVGSLAMWDNRAAQHNPINDYHGYKRLMHRITLKGERPY